MGDKLVMNMNVINKENGEAIPEISNKNELVDTWLFDKLPLGKFVYLLVK